MIRRAAAASALALAVANCGATPPSMARLQNQATRVCDQARARGAAIRAPAVPAQTGAFLKKGLALIRPELAALRRLQPPRGDAGAYSAAVGAMTREVNLLSSTAKALDRGADPLSAIKTLQRRLTPVEADDDAAWQTLGVPACVTS
jgi:hypothetical protein